MAKTRTYENSNAIFVDDMEFNFDDKHECKPVMIIRAQLGQRIRASDPFWDKCNMKDLKAYEDEKDPIFYRNSGISIHHLKEMQKKLKNHGHKNIEKVFFDWDRTLSAFDGLFDTYLIAKWIRNGCWDIIRDQMFGGAKRIKLLVDLLVELQQQKRVQIVTNQETSTGIRHVLRQLASDFDKPSLARIPVWAYKSREKLSSKYVSKFLWLRKELGAATCDM